MKIFLRLSTVIFVLFTAAFILPEKSFASEGLIELRSATRESYRCFASSFLMQDSAFTISVSCRDLLYPASDTVFSYVLWATPRDGGNPIRLGELGYGRLTARTAIPFTSLYATTEPNAGVGKPSGPVVMRGNVQRITFLDRETTPTLNPSGTIAQSNNGDGEVTPTPTAGQSTGEKLMTALRRAGLAAFLAFLALIGLVFAITKARG